MPGGGWRGHVFASPLQNQLSHSFKSGEKWVGGLILVLFIFSSQNIYFPKNVLLAIKTWWCGCHLLLTYTGIQATIFPVFDDRNVKCPPQNDVAGGPWKLPFIISYIQNIVHDISNINLGEWVSDIQFKICHPRVLYVIEHELAVLKQRPISCVHWCCNFPNQANECNRPSTECRTHKKR